VPSLLKEARRVLKRTQQEMALCLGVSQAAISGWEMGTNSPELHRLRAVAEAYRVDVADLIPSAGARKSRKAA